MHGAPKLTNRNEVKHSFSRLFIKFGFFLSLFEDDVSITSFWCVEGTEDDVATESDGDVSGQQVGGVVMWQWYRAVAGRHGCDVISDVEADNRREGAVFSGFFPHHFWPGVVLGRGALITPGD